MATGAAAGARTRGPALDNHHENAASGVQPLHQRWSLGMVCEAGDMPEHCKLSRYVTQHTSHLICPLGPQNTDVVQSVNGLRMSFPIQSWTNTLITPLTQASCTGFIVVFATVEAHQAMSNSLTS